jgi:hypothetical protein
MKKHVGKDDGDDYDDDVDPDEPTASQKGFKKMSKLQVMSGISTPGLGSPLVSVFPRPVSFSLFLTSSPVHRLLTTMYQQTAAREEKRAPERGRNVDTGAARGTQARRGADGVVRLHQAPGGAAKRQAVVREFYGSALARVVSNREWAAANDAVTGIVALNEHGCFLTLALDGFHR